MSLAHDNSRTVGRKKHWSEDMQARFKAGRGVRYPCCQEQRSDTG